ncbi:ABC transporter permease [Arsenicibacter rosenii]|uniref:ABC transporter permease n=1 Tax=Arsenicibacter rosenii TaxID=1750698 RepID=A0A1S2VE69_9BACT|nr:ABC transporter permease [Arsenicibacter rosenii]OIN56208.1 hypothetical protein BLX24_25755 [Arsenicibacter rosenii]
MIQNYLKIAVRQLMKHWGHTLINSGGLALGIACCLLIGLYVTDELSYDRFHTQFPHIYRIVEKQTQSGGIFDVAVTPGPLAASVLRDFPEVQDAARIGQWHGLLTAGRKSVEASQMLVVDPSFFRLFSFPLVKGNSDRLFRSPNEVVISETVAARFFGPDWQKQPVLGKLLTLTGNEPLKLVGVAKNPPRTSHIQFDVLIPFMWLEKNDEWSNKWNSNSYHTYIQLRPEASGKPADPAGLATKLDGQLAQYNNDKETRLLLQPLSEIYLYSRFAFQTDYGNRSDITYIRLFSIVGIIVLLIAIVNFVNLATARASQRSKEVGVRKTIGAYRSSLVMQFLGEALLLVMLAVTFSLVLAERLLPAFNELAVKTLSLPYADPLFWAILAGFTLCLSVLSGLYPALILSSFRPMPVLRGNILTKDGRTGLTLRQTLVVGQFMLAIGLVITTMVVYQQLLFMQTRQLGFDKSQLLYVRLKGALRERAMPFKQAVAGLPGVENAALSTGNLVNMENSSNVEWEGQAHKDEFQITQMNVDADFMKTVGMSVAAGRMFSDRVVADTLSGQAAYMINATAAKRMGWLPHQAIGKRMTFWGTPGRVIGVVNDFHYKPLRVGIQPFIFRYRPKEFYFTLLVRTSPARVAQAIQGISAAYKKLEPNYPISYGFVDQDLDAQYQSEQRIGKIMFCFAVLTILISCLGLFGLTAFTAEQRTKEIGVRKVLGASVGNIVALLSKDTMKPVGMALLLVVPLVWLGLQNWLANYAYRITLSGWMFAVAGLGAVSIALMTVGYQSIKAALANPSKALRSE